MKSFVTKIYLFKFFDDFILIYPLYAVMFTDFSMQPWQVATLLAIWSITSFLFEVPSGVWADKYSRRNILFLGQIIRALGYACWILFPNFIGFMAGFILWGIKGALTSGTFQALIYDGLFYYNKEQDFTKVYGTTKTLSFVAILLASLLASPFVILGYPTILLLSIFSVLISAVFAYFLPNNQKKDSTHEKEYFTILKQGLSEITKNKYIIKLLLFLSLAFALGGALDEYWPIFADSSGLPIQALGLFLAAMSGAQALASYTAYKFDKLSNRFFYFLFFINGCLLLLASYLFNLPTLVLLVIFSSSFTLIQTVFEGRLQHKIDQETRATVSSVSGFLTEVGVLVVYFSFGAIAQLYTYQASFMFFGILILIVGLFYLLTSFIRRG